ncbi:hypothetical protein [Paenibacillus taiwanensis]|uniref:hypothetical protein n=1 Tax=Paenibacillus taiwanensis TaxID=401638 RepID=UPI0004131783|nr:hypothetical protein [Paenibacillus taiwanensis]
MEVIQFGSFTLQWSMLVLLVSLIFGIVAIALRLKMENVPVKPWTEWASTIFVCILLNEKFGYLWDSPSIIWNQTKALLFLSGTSINGNILLIIGLIAWTITYIRKHQLRYGLLLDVAAHGLLMGLAVYGFMYAYSGAPAPYLTPLPLPAVMAVSLPPFESIMSLLLLVGLWLRKRELGSYADAQLAALVAGVIGMLLSYLFPDDKPIVGLTALQWVSIVMLVVAYVITRTRERVAAVCVEADVVTSEASPWPLGEHEAADEKSGKIG